LELSSLKFNKEIKTYERELTENLSHNDPNIRKEATLSIEFFFFLRAGFVDKIYQFRIFIQCPKCQIKRVITVPRNLVAQSQCLTTVAMSFGLACNHSFNVFIDKNFKVRGYQKV